MVSTLIITITRIITRMENIRIIIRNIASTASIRIIIHITEITVSIRTAVAILITEAALTAVAHRVAVARIVDLTAVRRDAARPISRGSFPRLKSCMILPLRRIRSALYAL